MKIEIVEEGYGFAQCVAHTASGDIRFAVWLETGELSVCPSGTWTDSSGYAVLGDPDGDFYAETLDAIEGWIAENF